MKAKTSHERVIGKLVDRHLWTLAIIVSMARYSITYPKYSNIFNLIGTVLVLIARPIDKIRGWFKYSLLKRT